jgi:hypothetical protein
MNDKLLAALFTLFSTLTYAQTPDSIAQKMPLQDTANVAKSVTKALNSKESIATKGISKAMDMTDSMKTMTNSSILKNALPSLLYQLALNFDFARGNQNYANFMPQVGLNSESNLFGLKSNLLYNYARLNGKTLNTDLTARNSASLFPRSTLPFQFLFGGESSKLRSLPSRGQTGLGFGINLIKKEQNRLRLNINGVYDRSRYNGTSFLNDASEKTNIRKVWGPLLQLSGQHQIKNGLAFLTYDIYNLIALNKKNDYRVNYMGSLIIPVFKNLNLRSSMIYSYENVIVQGTKHADFYWTFGFGVGQF